MQFFPKVKFSVLARVREWQHQASELCTEPDRAVIAMEM